MLVRLIHLNNPPIWWYDSYPELLNKVFRVKRNRKLFVGIDGVARKVYTCFKTIDEDVSSSQERLGLLAISDVSPLSLIDSLLYQAGHRSEDSK